MGKKRLYDDRGRSIYIGRVDSIKIDGECFRGEIRNSYQYIVFRFSHRNFGALGELGGEGGICFNRWDKPPRTPEVGELLIFQSLYKNSNGDWNFFKEWQRCQAVLKERKAIGGLKARLIDRSNDDAVLWTGLYDELDEHRDRINDELRKKFAFQVKMAEGWRGSWPF